MLELQLDELAKRALRWWQGHVLGVLAGPAAEAACLEGGPIGMASFDRPKRDTRSRAKQLTPAELRFVELIGGGSSLAEAVTTLGKSPRTLRRWKSRPEIAEAIRARTNAGLALARATLASAANRSARELIRLAEKAKPDAVRVAACKAVLEEAVKLGSLQDLEAAVAELEARLGTTGGRP